MRFGLLFVCTGLLAGLPMVHIAVAQVDKGLACPMMSELAETAMTARQFGMSQAMINDQMTNGIEPHIASIASALIGMAYTFPAYDDQAKRQKAVTGFAAIIRDDCEKEARDSQPQ